MFVDFGKEIEMFIWRVVIFAPMISINDMEAFNHA